MADIAPLTPLRYDLARLTNGLADVVAPPYDVISPDERKELAHRHPENVVRLILPDGEGDAKYTHAAALLEEWRRAGALVRDDEPAFYRYDQSFAPPGDPSARRVTRRGFLALVRLRPYEDRVVLPHERTLSGPKEDRLKLFRATRTNLSPGFMLYRDPARALDSAIARATTLAEMSTHDGVHHVLAKITDREALRAITLGVAKSALLIADGHHRYETALRYSQEVGAGEKSESRYFMCFLANEDDPNLLVFPTHRHVHSLASFDWDRMTAGARDTFDVLDLGAGADHAAVLAALAEAGRVGPSVAACGPDGRCAVFTLRRDIDVARHATLGARPAVLRTTDVAVLHSAILEHLLGITPEAQAAKTNLWYPQDARAALADLRGGRGQALFLMNSTPVAAVRKVAEAGEVMPQKSTFFYPKVLTGLAIHTLEAERQVAAP